MAASRRLRFEILKRDNYSCRYCGAKAPDVTLTVDHVIPTTLGGGDEPNNLVTACQPCNSGKASVSPESGLVEDVDAAALLWAKAMERAHEMRRTELDDIDRALNQFNGLWRQGLTSAYDYGRPENWDGSIVVFLQNGLTMEDLCRYVNVAFTARINTDTVWRYFCGCCWNEISRRQELARTLIEDGQV